MKQWWAENRQYPEAWKPGDDHKPKEAQGKPYQLPLGVERIGQIVKVPGNRQGDIWTVDLDKSECDCPAFGRFPGRASTGLSSRSSAEDVRRIC